MFQNLINIITSPQEAFNSLKEKPTVLVPLLIIIVMSALVQILYFSNVDKEFFIDQTVEQAMRLVNVPESQIREGLADTDPASSRIRYAIAVAIFLPFVLAISAGYFAFISKFTSDGIGFKKWYSLVTWTGIITVFSALAAIVVILMSADGRIAQSQLQPFSLNNLIFQTGGRFQTMLSSIGLTQFWTLGLMTLGYQNWTGKSITTSGIIVTVPYLVIYGIWVLIIIL